MEHGMNLTFAPLGIPTATEGEHSPYSADLIGVFIAACGPILIVDLPLRIWHLPCF